MQSIGAGGGTGGAGKSSLTLKKDKDDEDDGDDSEASATAVLTSGSGDDDSYNFSLKTGAGGGSGGAGAHVYFGIGEDGGPKKLGTTSTKGDFAYGVIAQSIGGGGGMSSAGNSSASSSKTASITLGATGGSGGAGGAVDVYASSVYTAGYGAHAVVAQSIGGGGGTSLMSGYAVSSATITLGSSNLDGDTNGGGESYVSLASGKSITTKGAYAGGIIAQSIGAGGGIASVALGTSSKVNDSSLSNVVSLTFGTTSHQEDETTLDGGEVEVYSEGSVTTDGRNAFGIVAQSIGGGGGFFVSNSNIIDTVSFQATQHRAGSDEVTVKLTGASIVTSGDGAAGIIAQSVAGGGGLAADLATTLAYAAPPSSGYSYDGDSTRYAGLVSVTVDEKSSIKTTGTNAHGIIAQSTAGSGGIFQKNGVASIGSIGREVDGTGAAVAVDIAGTVDAGGWAVVGHSQDRYVNITFEEGATVSGSLGLSYAMVSASGTITVDNAAKATGSVISLVGGTKQSTAADGEIAFAAAPAAGRSLFINRGTGVLQTGTRTEADTFLNAGAIDIGGLGTRQRTVFTGDVVGVGTDGSDYDGTRVGIDADFTPVTFYERGEKKLWRDGTTSRGGLIAGIDADLAAGTSDEMIVKGDFAGTWGATLNPTTLLPNRRIDFLKIAGEDTSDLTVLPSLVFSFTAPSTTSEGWTGVEVASAHFDDTGIGLGDNAREAARGLQSAWERLADGSAEEIPFGAASISLAETFAVFHLADPKGFEAMLETVTAQTTAAPPAVAPQSAIMAMNSVMSCPVFTTGAMLEEGECVWGRGLGFYTEQNGSPGTVGYIERSAGFQTGAQKAVGEGWFLGGSLTYEVASFRSDSEAEKLDATSFVGALAVKKEVGPWLFALAGGAGYTWGESSRYLTLGSLSATARANPNSAALFGRARASYEVTLGERFYLRPTVDLDLIGVFQDGYTERGAGGLNLVVEDTAQALFGFTPSLEVGGRVDLTPQMPVRLFAIGGLTVLSDDDWEQKVRFAGISTMDAFSTYVPYNDIVGRVSAGIDLQNIENFELKLQYDGAFADDYQSHGGSLRLGYRF